MGRLILSLIVILPAIILLVIDMRQPALVVRAGGNIIFLRASALTGYSFNISFKHSVEQTMVKELLRVTPKKTFNVYRTEYQSQGVGLPFLPEEGEFHREGELFVLEGMSRDYGEISLRTGLGTKLTLTFPECELRLYEAYPAGTKIDIFVEPLYQLADKNKY